MAAWWGSSSYFSTFSSSLFSSPPPFDRGKVPIVSQTFNDEPRCWREGEGEAAAGLVRCPRRVDCGSLTNKRWVIEARGGRLSAPLCGILNVASSTHIKVRKQMWLTLSVRITMRPSRRQDGGQIPRNMIETRRFHWERKRRYEEWLINRRGISQFISIGW